MVSSWKMKYIIGRFHLTLLPWTMCYSAELLLTYEMIQPVNHLTKLESHYSLLTLLKILSTKICGINMNKHEE